MTIAKDFAGKAAVAFVAVAMFLSMIAPAAQAQSSEDLQKMINDLLAQIAALQGQVGQGGVSASGVCPYTWTRDLKTGTTGADVMKLQQFLNADADTRVAASGVGSVGAETEYFGALTAAAVSKFQVKYRSEILSPNGLVNPTGYFGPSTRAKANSSCVAAPVVVVPTPGTDNGSDDGDTDDKVTLSGEADLDDVVVEDPQDDSIQEGDNDAELGTVTVTFKNGDARIDRLDISLVADSGNDEKDPWDTFSSVSLWVDGEKVKEVKSSSRNDYLDKDDGSLRFSGLDLIGMEDEEVEITVAADIKTGMDDSANGEGWTLMAESIRFFDADGVATTDNSSKDLAGPGNATFTIEEAGFEDEIIIKTSTSDPDGTTLRLEDNKKSDWFTVFVFDIDTDDSLNDITLNTIKVNVQGASTTVGYSTLVDDAELIIDGVKIDSSPSDVTNATTALATISFDVDGDVVIDAGDRVKAELRLRFKSLAAANEGLQVRGVMAPATTANIDAEGADDLDNGKLSGSATGDYHTLRTMGISVAKKSTSAVVTTGQNNLDDYATYEIKVDVTAFEQDVRISTNPSTSTTYTLEDGSGATATTGTRSVTLTSTGDENGGYFEINQGETETLTFKVTYSPGVANTAARLVLGSIKFADTPSTPDQTWMAVPAKDYRTEVVTIVN